MEISLCILYPFMETSSICIYSANSVVTSYSYVCWDCIDICYDQFFRCTFSVVYVFGMVISIKCVSNVSVEAKKRVNIKVH